MHRGRCQSAAPGDNSQATSADAKHLRLSDRNNSVAARGAERRRLPTCRLSPLVNQGEASQDCQEQFGPGAKEEQQAAGRYLFNKDEEGAKPRLPKITSSLNPGPEESTFRRGVCESVRFTLPLKDSTTPRLNLDKLFTKFGPPPCIPSSSSSLIYSFDLLKQTQTTCRPDDFVPVRLSLFGRDWCLSHSLK
ncbi:uncharacterized protein V6R79_016950 [Siganus canaliculatus]